MKNILAKKVGIVLVSAALTVGSVRIFYRACRDSITSNIPSVANYIQTTRDDVLESRFRNSNYFSESEKSEYSLRLAEKIRKLEEDSDVQRYVKGNTIRKLEFLGGSLGLLVGMLGLSSCQVPRKQKEECE